jgi:phosphoribosylformylglycinamidine synthase
MATAEIHVTLKPALLDTEGATVRKALHQLGYPAVRDVRVGKFITVELDGNAAGPQAQAMLEEMCQKLLANPVIEDFEITLDAASSRAATNAPVALIPVAPLVDVPLSAAPGSHITAANIAAATTPASPAGSPQSSTAAGIAGASASLPLTPQSAMISSPTATSSVTGASTSTDASSNAATHALASAAHAPNAGTSAGTNVLPGASGGAAQSMAAPPMTVVPSSVSPGSTSSGAEATPVSALSPSQQMQAQVASSSHSATPDPFAMDFAVFDSMGPADKMAMQELAWRKYGAWIRDELDARRAAWILCVGQNVAQAGDSLDTFPDDATRMRAGHSSGLVPWVFVRPPAL